MGLNAGYGATGAYQSNFFGVCWSEATNAYLSNFIGRKLVKEQQMPFKFIGQAAGDSNCCLFIKFLGYGAGNYATMLHTQILHNLAGNGAINANNSNFFGNLAGNAATNANQSNFIGLECW
jgi:hypothetical protein